MKQILYHTINSWNQSESYAYNLVITRLGLDYEVADKLFELIDTQEFFVHQTRLLPVLEKGDTNYAMPI